MAGLVKDGHLVTNHWNWQFETISEVRFSGNYYLTLALIICNDPWLCNKTCTHCCFDVSTVCWSSIHFISCSEGSSILECKKIFLFAGGNHTLGSGNHTIGSGNHTLGSGNPLVACLMSHLSGHFSRLWLHSPAHTNSWPHACKWLAYGSFQLLDVTYYQWQTMQVMVIQGLMNKFNTKVIFGTISYIWVNSWLQSRWCSLKVCALLLCAMRYHYAEQLLPLPGV